MARENKFFRAVILLAGGTAGAQLILVLALPVVTRLYSPEQFSDLSAFIAISGIFSTAACLRLDLAIPLPKRDSESIHLLFLSIIFSIATSSLILFIILIIPEHLLSRVLPSVIYNYAWILPLGVFLSSTYNALQYWATRKKLFSVIARTKFEQSLAAVSTQIGAGYFIQTPIILILGQILHSSTGIFRLAKAFTQLDIKHLAYISPRSLFITLRKYKNFPKYSTIESLANTAGIQLPFILISTALAGPEAGYLMLASRILQSPLSLLGSAISQVYLTHAPQAHREGNLSSLTYKTLVNLMKVGIGPIIFAGTLSPFLFPYIFGKDWSRAGVLAAWITPWVALQFISSPISMIGHVLNRQKLMLLLTIFGFSIRAGGVFYFSYGLKSSLASEYYAVSGFIFYLTCTLVFTRCAGIPIIKIFSALTESAYYIGFWILSACFGIYILKWIS
ncbi:lipopolysaccharide biosynthesis protein [Pseudomonas sp. GCEP-101]|uniref:lipopolysaccharide biosynthesis protein n=1 Tax=Pseudomonas sp. GCEP-101 TaxID=2974552 RepID=UPI00223C0739|nr:oligosaccharide flippase family protein [Pseudomonas sp. GCEP-101]